MKEILFIGDSLIEFFDWQSRFPQHTILNLGRAGETVEGLLARVDNIIREYPSPDLVFIMTGINNVAMEDLDFLDSYRTIMERLSSAYPQARIISHSLLPTLLPWISDGSIQEMNRAIEKMARQTGIGFMDIYTRFVDREGKVVKDYLSPDGVHLSHKGYTAWADALEGLINQN
jgi:lysophospholipase L1-like esterase